MLHVGRFVHADGQLDPEVAVRTAFGHRHLVELGLFGAVGGRVEHHLGGTARRTHCSQDAPKRNQRTFLQSRGYGYSLCHDL
jgi:thiamine pyrophosphokinase